MFGPLSGVGTGTGEPRCLKLLSPSDFDRLSLMKATLRLAVVLVTVLAALGPWSRPAFADEGPLDPAPPKGISADDIIKRFAAKETEFQQARDQYTYRQDVTVKTPEDDGEYHEIFDVLFDDQGKRLEKSYLRRSHLW